MIYSDHKRMAFGSVTIESDGSVEATDVTATTVAATTASATTLALAQYIEGTEIADPAAPAANKGRLYFKDNGSGKTQLVVRFPTGAVQVIATEP